MTQHLQAFEKGDFQAAFELLSPTFQKAFGSAERLETTVVGTYPEYIESKKIYYLVASKVGSAGNLWIVARFLTKSGKRVQAFYLLTPGGKNYVILSVTSFSIDRPQKPPKPIQNDPFRTSI